MKDLAAMSVACGFVQLKLFARYHLCYISSFYFVNNYFLVPFCYYFPILLLHYQHDKVLQACLQRHRYYSMFTMTQYYSLLQVCLLRCLAVPHRWEGASHETTGSTFFPRDKGRSRVHRGRRKRRRRQGAAGSHPCQPTTRTQPYSLKQSQQRPVQGQLVYRPGKTRNIPCIVVNYVHREKKHFQVLLHASGTICRLPCMPQTGSVRSRSNRKHFCLKECFHFKRTVL